MAKWVLSECGVSPLPRLYPKPRTGIPCSNSNEIWNTILTFKTSNLITMRSSLSRMCRDRNWGLKVSAPVSMQFVDDDDEKDEFNPGAPPPFTLADIRAAIPKHCWVKDPWRSMSYVLRDVVIVFGLAAVAVYFNNTVVWPLYWIAQSTMFWALFVLGHDCGHGSFSNNAKLNSVAGHLLHSSILVPYHGWRISHRTHHQNHGHIENDESWHPLSEKIYRSLENATRILRFSLPFPMLAYPFYLVSLLTLMDSLEYYYYHIFYCFDVRKGLGS